MLLKIFGLLDLFAGLLLVLAHFTSWYSLLLILAVLLFIKGVLFLWDINSIIDVISSVVMIFASLGYTSILTWIVAFWLLQKGFFSLLSSV